MTEKYQHPPTRRRGTVAVKLAVSVLLAAGGVAHAQTRFDVVSHEMVAAVPNLEIVSVRDRVLDNCYTLFLFQPQSAAPAVAPVDSATLDAALADRNRKLDALSADLQRQVETPRVVTVPNPLRFEFDGQKALVDFEQIAMEAMVARVDARLAEIATAPRLAVAGPVTCPAVPPATKASRPAGHP